MLIDAKYRDRLEPGMLTYIDRLPQPPAAGHVVSIDEQRRRYNERCAAFRAPRAPGVDARDETLPGAEQPIPVRLYAAGHAPRGCVLYMHGGSWVVGDLDSHDDICSEIAAHTGALVCAIHYRRVPEYTYPAAFEDCCAVFEHVCNDPVRFGDRLVVAGDSAGGNLAAALALKARDVNTAPLAGQVLVYPLLCADQSLPAYTELHDAPLFTTPEAIQAVTDYMGQRVSDPYAAPLAAHDFSRLAPAYVCVAELDPLRDDGIEYANRLRSAGTPAELLLATGLTHAFLRARHISAGAGVAFRGVTDAIKSFLR